VLDQYTIAEEIPDAQNRSILEKLIVAEKEEMISQPRHPRPYYLVQKNPPNDFVVSQLNPARTHTHL
jgi:hypothetical protein